MQVCQQIKTHGKKMLNFCLPVHKPAGMCCLKLGESFKLDLYFVLQHHGLNPNQILFNNSSYMEPHASGLMTFIVGKPALAKRKNFVLTDNLWNMTIEFGVERELNCIDGPVIARRETGDLTASKIREALTKFEGQILQDRLAAYRGKQQQDGREPLQLAKHLNWQPFNMSAVDIINQIVLPPSKKERGDSVKPKQKYAKSVPKREATVQRIELIHYSEPFGELRIASDGSFKPRQFVQDLASSLGTFASLISLTRAREGPLHVNDPLVLQPYELHFEYYYSRLPVYKEIYEEFHRQMDPLWDARPS